MVTEHLLPGKKNAITGETLAARLGVGPRDISLAVERERRAGAPICASCDAASPGYFLGDVADVALYLLSIDRRIRNTILTKQAMQMTLSRMTGQTCLWGDEYIV